MMCYKDKTFCALKTCAFFNECTDAFTDEVKKAAKKSGLMVSLCSHENDCYIENGSV